MNQPPFSYWESSSFFQQIDIAIIGSGIVGLSAAIAFKQQKPNLRVAILERGMIPTGASTRNAGFACFGSVTELLDDLQTQPENEVFALVERRYRGLQVLRQRLGDTAIGYQHKGGFEVFTHTDPWTEYQHAIPYLNQQVQHAIGVPQVYTEAHNQLAYTGFEGMKYLIWNHAEGQIHTGKMMTSLLQLAKQQGVEIWNGVQIKHLEQTTNSTGVHLWLNDSVSLQANKVLVCTNGFAASLLPQLHVTPARNQVIVTEPIANLPFSGCYHYDKGYIYFRDVDGRVLLGGGRNTSFDEETTDQFGTTQGIQNYLRHFLDTHILPHQKVAIAYCWSGIMGLGNQKKPIVQMISADIGVSVRMGGMGVAIGSLVGNEGAQMILDS
jgi:gamma-glutamylputrescine oxidase